MTKIIIFLIGILLIAWQRIYTKNFEYRYKWAMIRMTIAMLSFAGLGIFISLSAILSLFMTPTVINVIYVTAGGIITTLSILFLQTPACKGDGGIGLGFIAYIGAIVGVLVFVYGCIVPAIL